MDCSLSYLRRSFLMIALTFSALLFTISPGRAQSGINWYSMKEAQQRADENGKKVLIFAEASWCIYCKKMKEEVFTQQAVIDSMNTYFYAVSVDIESDQSMLYNGRELTGAEFARYNQVRATPTFFFLTENGKKLGAQPGFIPAQTFSRLLGFVGSDAFKRMEFKNYLKQHVPKSERKQE